jgi:pterin-4a-carbinolamine dehydratase
MMTLTPARIEAEPSAVPHWSRQGQSMARTFQFKDFAVASLAGRPGITRTSTFAGTR